MSRDWHAVYSSLARKPKYRRLTIPARAALFHVWILAGGQTPEATWPSRDALQDMLELDGYPPECLDELVTRGWLDVDEDRVLVHDWDEHQLAATGAAMRAYEADRKREWRRRKTPDRPSPLRSTPGHTRSSAEVEAAFDIPLSPRTPISHITSQDITRQMSPSVRDTSGTCPGCGKYPNQLLDEEVVRVGRAEWHRSCRAAAQGRTACDYVL